MFSILYKHEKASICETVIWKSIKLFGGSDTLHIKSISKVMEAFLVRDQLRACVLVCHLREG